GAVALLFGLPELFFVAATCAGLVLAAAAGVLLRPPLRIACAPARRRVPAGTPLAVGVRVSNGARRRTAPSVEIIDDSAEGTETVLSLPALPSGAALEERYCLSTERRGWRVLGPVWMEVTDPFGLALHRHRAAPRDKVLVWPRIDDLAGFAAAVEDATERRRHTRIVPGAETDLHSLRRYEPGDDPHRIHWPSSTRHRELLVRRFETVERPETLLYLETDADAATAEVFERMVSAAAGLATLAASAGGTVRLITRGGAEVRATGSAVPILDALAFVAQSRPEDLAAPLLPVGAARMILLAVVGDMAPHRPDGLPRFPGRRVILQFWQNEAPSSHRDVVAVGPEDSTALRWQEHLARRSGTAREREAPTAAAAAG
ncbi:MAG: DUF58 domain-containing protein, partial [bacterium]|nr:DUF58 domain-containing protein [bacterium]